MQACFWRCLGLLVLSVHCCSAALTTASVYFNGWANKLVMEYIFYNLEHKILMVRPVMLQYHDRDDFMTQSAEYCSPRQQELRTVLSYIDGTTMPVMATCSESKNQQSWVFPWVQVTTSMPTLWLIEYRWKCVGHRNDTIIVCSSTHPWAHDCAVIVWLQSLIAVCTHLTL